MSDDKKTENERPTLPPMTANDWQILIQSVVAMVTMGVTVIEVHPARWLLIVDAALRFGGPMVEPVRNARGEVTARKEERQVPTGGGALDPVSREVPWTPSDIKALARKALELRQPELQGASLEDLIGIEDEDAIDVEAALAEDEDG